MSVVTNVMVSFTNLENEDPETVPRLLAWFADKGELRSITHGWADPPPHGWGGNKHPECELWAGAYNHLDLDGMLQHVASIAWAYPQFVQVFVKEQEAATFAVYMFREGRLGRVLPYVAWD
jgi:hypothetical protein